MGKTREKHEEKLRQLGERLRSVRERKNFTQEQLAEESGLISISSISRIEGGKLDPSATTMMEIAAVLGVSVKTLFDY